MKIKVNQIEAVELADGHIQVRREFHVYRDTLTVEVRDERRYLKATTYNGGEIANLFYFLKPLVQRFLQKEDNYYSKVIEENSKKIKKAKAKAKENPHIRVFDFLDKSFYGGKIDLSIEKAEAKLKEQKERLLQIREELKVLKTSKVKVR